MEMAESASDRERVRVRPEVVARKLGTAVVVLSVTFLAASLFRAGEFSGLGDDRAAVRAAWPAVGLSFNLLFGWWARAGDRRGRSFAWALVGPLLIGIAVPGGLFLLALNFAVAGVGRRT